jgi:hypothetical protein
MGDSILDVLLHAGPLNLTQICMDNTYLVVWNERRQFDVHCLAVFTATVGDIKYGPIGNKFFNLKHVVFLFSEF